MRVMLSGITTRAESGKWDFIEDVCMMLVKIVSSRQISVHSVCTVWMGLSVDNVDISQYVYP